MQKEHYRPKEAAQYLGVCTASIWNYIKAGKIKAHKLTNRVTVIHRLELEKFAHISH